MLTTETQEKIQALIRESLPSAVGDELATVLRKAATMEDSYKVASEELKDKLLFIQEQEEELIKFRAGKCDLDDSWVEYNKLTEAADKRDINLQLREAVINLREAHANDKVAGLHGVVMAVFSNNRYKYERTTTAPVVVPGTPASPDNQHGYGGMPATLPHIEDRTTTETGEGES